jgi:hypothetical protein
MVYRSPTVLIGNARTATIDIYDIGKFNNTPTLTQYNLCPQSILIHELYEQYYLQVVKGLKPLKAPACLLKHAHDNASQYESLVFDIMLQKTRSNIVSDKIIVEFTCAIDEDYKVVFYVHFEKGNATLVERVLN